MTSFLADDLTRARTAFEAAPFHPEKWTEGLDLFAKIAGGWAGQLIAASPTKLAANIITQMPAEATAEWERRGGAIVGVNPRARSLLDQPFRVTADNDYLTPEAQARSPFYQELFNPLDANFISVGKLGDHGDINAVVCAIHTARQGYPSPEQHRRIAAMLPYVDAALRTQLLLNARDMQTMIKSLDAVSIAAFVCDAWGSVTAMTEAGESLLRSDSLFRLSSGKLVACDRNREARLQEAIRLASARFGTWPPVARQTTLVLAETSGDLRRVDVAPVPPDTMRLASGAASIVMVTTPQPVPDTISLLRHAFEFTAAEAAVALDLAQGHSSVEIADRRQVSIATVRAQIHVVLHKAGCTKASAFAAMVGRFNL